MGKKKPKQQAAAAKNEPEKIVKEAREQRVYSYASGDKKGGDSSSAEEKLLKVQLPADTEAEIVDLILNHKKHQTMSGSASQRLTSKKLTDMYMSLSSAGFKHSQIEQAMSAVVHYGGDLTDALDWLCLNTRNDQLPSGFSVTLHEEEKRRRPQFTATQTAERHLAEGSTPPSVVEPLIMADVRKEKEASVPQTGEDSKGMKSWILQYSQQSDSDSEGDSLQSQADPNERYLELTAKLLDAKAQALDAKRMADKTAVKQISKTIRDYVQEMDNLEQHADFNPSIKIKDIERDKEQAQSLVPPSAASASQAPAAAAAAAATTTTTAAVVKPLKVAPASTEDEELGLALFEEQALAEKPKPPVKKKTPVKDLDKREFAYTRQQWTGKSPKQFLIDWVRKHLPKSPPPKYERVNVGGNLYRSRARIVRKDVGDLVVCPEIVCENLKDAEHLASTLALYNLCKGQRVYQLLPPPYRDVWLEWQDAETKAKQETKAETNKPRDQLVAQLMKKLKIDQSKTTTQRKDDGGDDEDEDVEESWEDLADEDEEETMESAIARVDASPSRTTKHKAHKPRLNVRNVLEKHQRTEGYKKLLETRRQLPVYKYQGEIVAAINKYDVVLIAGETGSGKSTQIPQFVLQDLIQSGAGAHTNIICTEPRRISATSLANRVSAELGEQGPGSRESLCGYQIRFEAKRCETTRLLYCTTGVLLRRMQNDPMLSEVSHVIVDEVHERSVDSDFLLIILQRILRQRRDLKVVLMSATLDSDKFSAYFQHCPVINIPGRTFPVEVFHLEDAVEMTGYRLEDDSPYGLRYDALIEEEKSQVTVTGKAGTAHTMDLSWSKDDISTVDQTSLDPAEYSLRTRNTVTRLNPDKVNTELIMDLLKYIDRSETFCEMEGAVLVFLPGLSHIQELYEMLLSDRLFSDKTRYCIIALHSILSSQDQNLAFDLPPPGVRKVVIATNIAETGITIPDVVFVIDSGKVKENRYVESSQMSKLEEVYISQASAKQRQGRAGRVREGVTFRLYTNERFQQMKPYSVPEILRVPLEELCLQIMKCEYGHPADFLSQALDAPSVQAVSRAMSILREVGACEQTAAELTPLGHHLAALPVNVRIGKMLIFGALLGCLQPTAVVAAAMTDKSPFVVPLAKREEADVARRSLATANSDHLTVYKAYLGWKRAQVQGYQSEMTYCRKCFLKRTTLIDINNVSKDLVKLVKSIGFSDVSVHDLLHDTKRKNKSAANDVLTISQSGASFPVTPDQLSSMEEAILKAALTAGLYPSIAKVWYTAPVDSAAYQDKEVCLAQTAQGLAQIHPASVNRFLGANGLLVYHEKVKLSRVYLRDSTLVSPYPVLLFGGDIDVQHKEQLIAVDDWIKFKAVAKTGVVFKELRLLIDNLLENKLKNPTLDISKNELVRTLVGLIVSERQHKGKSR